MFPVSYFAPAYFAERYFAEIGATPPPPPPTVLGQIRITINGIDATRFCYDTGYASALKWQLTRGNRGSCTIPFMVPPADPFAPQIGEAIEIFDPLTTRVWAGTIQAVEIKWLGDDGWKGLTLSGVSYESLFDSADVGGIKYGVGTSGPSTCGECVIDLFMRVGFTEISLGLIQDGPPVEALTVNSVWTGFTDLATLAGFYVYIDPVDLTLNFHTPLARAAYRPYGRKGDIVWESLDFTQTSADVRNAQVIQNPGQAQTPLTATFPGDGITTEFHLPTVPLYIISIAVSPTGNTGKSVTAPPGTTDIFVTPAPLTTEQVVVTYMDQGTSTGTADTPGVPSRTARYSKTRTWTQAGGLQYANALLARYSLLPSQLVFSTDQPGVALARALTLDVIYPRQAGVILDGTWLVFDIQATIIPGADNLEEPWGHFRYLLTMVNAAATAIFQGDGATTTFVLPVIPTSAEPTITTVGPPGEFIGSPSTWETFILTYDPATGILTVDPPLPPGVCVIVDTVDGQEQFCGDGTTPDYLISFGSPPVIPDSIDAIITNFPDLAFGSPPTIPDFTLNGDPITSITTDPALPADITIGIIGTTPDGNTAVAALPADGSTTTFALPQALASVQSIMAYGANWETASDQITATPALPPGSSMSVNYTGNNAPDVVNNIAAWAQLTEEPPAPTPVPNTVTIPPTQYVVGLLIKDTTVGDDIADHVPIYHDGTAMRLLGVLRKLISADLTVRINKRDATFATLELITATIPSSAVVDEVFEWSLASGSPPTLPPFLDKEVLSADILESDGSKDVDGIASFTIEWELS